MKYTENDYFPYINNSSYFYTKPIENDDDFECNIPDGWQKKSDDSWVYCLNKSIELPIQGWKIHISCDYEHEELVLKLVSQYLFERQICFKFTKSKSEWLLKNSKYADRSSAGKFITVYPKNESEFVQTVLALSKILKDYPHGPYILSDRRWQDSSVYYRYGAFKKITKIENDQAIYCIKNPDGELIEDKRVPYYYQPDFVKEPEYLAKNNFMVKGVNDAELRKYKITAALHFSNGGGVYVGNLNNKKYVLKEGRPYAGMDGRYQDGFSRIKRESKYLERLTEVSEVVNFKEYFCAWKHNYLVEEYLDGKTIIDYVADNYPFYNGEKQNYVERTLLIAKQILKAVENVHAKSVAIGDLQPDNIMIINSPEGEKVKLLDLEQAHNLTDPYHPGLATKGFSNLSLKTYEQADWYGVYKTIRYLFIPIIDLSGYADENVQLQNQNIKKYFSEDAADFLNKLNERLSVKYPAVYSDKQIKMPNLDEMIEKISRGITNHLDFDSDNLIKGDIINFKDKKTCFNVEDGALGLGILIARTDNDHLKEKFYKWLKQKQSMIEKLMVNDSGLMTGKAGIGTVLYELGNKNLGRKIIEEISWQNVTDISIESGLSGIGLAKLALQASEERIDQKEITEIGRRIIEYYDKANHKGLLNGQLGAILFLWKIGVTLSLDNFKRLSVQKIDQYLDQNLCHEEGHVFVKDTTLGMKRNLPYVYDGTAGLLLTLLEMISDDPSLKEKYWNFINASLKTMDVFCSFMNGLYDGFSGLLLSDIAAKANDLPEKINQKVDLLNNYLVKNNDELLTPNTYGGRCSMDLATGALGVLASLIGIKENDWGLWLPVIRSENFRIFRA